MTEWGNPGPAECLGRLKSEIGEGNYAVRLVTSDRHPHLRVTNRHATQLTEDIYCDGRSFWWSWHEPIAPVADVAAAAAKVTRVTQAWISGMKLAPSSARQVIRDVSSVFIAAADDGLIGRNPVQAKSVTRPKVTERKAQPWALAEVEAVAEALQGRFAVLPYLGAGSGMRQGELFGIAAEDVDFLRKVIHVRRQVRLAGNARCFAPVKNRKAHDVPLAESLVPLLAEHIRRYPPVEVTLPWLVPDGDPVTHALLLTGTGGALHRDAFNKTHWRPGQTRAGIDPGRRAGCHVLRHTAASAWLSAGVDIVKVAAWLGDTVATVWKSYAHFMPDADDRGRKAMDVFFTRVAEPGSARNVHGERQP